MEWISTATDVISLFSAMFALFAWRESRRTNKAIDAEKKRLYRNIKVVLHNGSQQIELPFELRRMEFTRAEVLGRIGMIPMKEKGKRYSIEYLNNPKFLHQINEIADGYGDSALEISCTEKEFNQFDISKENNWFKFGR